MKVDVLTSGYVSMDHIIKIATPAKVGFTHFDEKGNAVMVDVHEKADTYRVAVAAGTITVNEEVFQAITNHTAKKGDVLGIARIAGIMGAKKNSELIPLCHIIALTDCEISFELDEKHRQIKATCKTYYSANTAGNPQIQLLPCQSA